MEKFAVVSVVNGNFSIVSEWNDDLDGARVAFHNYCAALWNESSVVKAVVRLVDSNFLTFMTYEEYIGHEVEPEPEV